MRVTIVPEGIVNAPWVVGEMPEALTLNTTEVGGCGDSVAVGVGDGVVCVGGGDSVI